jgi:hypothetical protein
MDQENLILRERDLLKTELQALKSCQVQYFSFTITATGVIFGIGEKFADKHNVGFVYLIPLLLIIPMWSIFFDKASSITRIVGYMRILESLLVHDNRFHYQGWENALRDFRKADKPNSFWMEPVKMILHAFCAIWPLVDFRRKHRYWAINWLTFCGLGICSLFMARRSGVEGKFFLLFTVFFIAACLHNADVLWNLVSGKYSYDKREELWQKVLGVQDISANSTVPPTTDNKSENIS